MNKKEILEKFGLECPSSFNCKNQGILSEHDTGCTGNPEDCVNSCPVPVQCEFCYTEPRSKMNLSEALDQFEKRIEEEMYLYMQHYMEYCQMKEYVTLKERIEKHKHF